MFTALLEKIALALDDADLSYMIIGGQAVLLYGEPRLTEESERGLGLHVQMAPGVFGDSVRAVPG